ncbi:MAG: YSC84-related protein [Gammaproteobacteria bacterium]
MGNHRTKEFEAMMNRLPLLLLALLAAAPSWADATDEKCQATLEVFRGLGNTSVFLADSYGYAVFPTIGKGGIGIGGAYGTGCVYRGGAKTGTASMGQVTIGFQLGGQAFSELIVFQSKAAYDVFTTGSFEFGAGASAVALTFGAQAGTGTTGSSASAGSTKGTGGWYRGMATFTLAKGGLMYEASIGGQKFNFKPIGSKR